MPRPLTWTILCTSTALVGAAGIVAWHVRAREARYVTDGAAIRVPEAAASTRDVRWRPAVHEAPLGSGLDDRDPVVSPDGGTMYFSRGSSGQDTDLFMSQRGPAGWSAPQALPGPVNTRSEELGPQLGADGASLYFASNRPGGNGLFDLWVTRRGEDGRWGDPENLGPAINSRYDDHAPAPSPDGRLLILASNRPLPEDTDAPGPDAWPSQVHAYARSLDDNLYVADLGNPSAAPVALAPLNGPAHDTAPAVSPVGDFVYFASDRPGGAGGFDLYRGRVVRGEIRPPERLGEGVNTPADELDPSVGMGGFGLHFASDRRAEATGAPGEAAPEAGWEIFSTTSREVFTESETWRAALDAAEIWRALRPYLMALLIMALVVAALLRALGSIRHRGLSLIVRALIGSIVVHMVLLVGFAFWSVSTAPGSWRRPGSGVQVVLYTPAATTGVSGQVRGRFTEVRDPRPADAVGRSAPQIEARPPQEVAAEVALERSELPAAEAPVLAADARDAPVPAPPEAAPTGAPAELAAVALDLPSPATPPDRAVPAHAAAVSGPVAIAAARPAAGFDEDRAQHTQDTAISMAPQGVVMDQAEASLADPAIHHADAVPVPLPVDGSPGTPGGTAALASLPDLALPGLPEGNRAAVPAPAAAPVPASHLGSLAAAAVESAAAPSPAAQLAPALDAAPRDLAAPAEPVADATLIADAAPPQMTAAVGPAGMALPEPPGPLRLDLPDMELPGAAAAGEAQQALPGDLAPDLHQQWLASAVAPAVPDARLRPAEVSIEPEPRPLDIPEPVMLESALALLDQPRPEAEFLPIELDLPLPRRSIAVPFQQRSQDNRQEILEKMGGDEQTEEAVARALGWLSRHQSPDGHWDCTEYDDRCGACRGMGQARADIALTGLAIMCFLAADHTPDRNGPHRRTVERAIDWLLRQQKQGGNLMGGDIESMYSHGIATTALAEAYGMTGDERFEQPVRRAIEFIQRSQALRGGGWRYTPGQSGDTSVTGWQIMALSAARHVNMAVPDAAFDVGALWMERVADPSRPGIYSYQPSYEPSEAMTAEGMFIRQLLGVARGEHAMQASARHLVKHSPAPEAPPNSYYWYYATLALFQHQGPEWQAWNDALKPMLLASQLTEGRSAGSWEIPVGDRWANVGGRVYQTAICTLTLEVYYRYLPRFLQEQEAGAKPVE